MTLVMLTVAVQLSAQEADRTRLSPMLIDRLTEPMAAARGMKPVDEEYILSLVKLTDGDEATLTRRGCHVVDRVGSVCIALLPVSQLAALSLDQRVVRMEANPLSRPMTDVTPAVVGADLVSQGLQLPQAYTGRGVVVGVCDVGVPLSVPSRLILSSRCLTIACSSSIVSCFSLSCLSLSAMTFFSSLLCA